MGTIRLKHSTNKYIKPLKRHKRHKKLTKNPNNRGDPNHHHYYNHNIHQNVVQQTLRSKLLSNNKNQKTSSKYLQNSKTMSKPKNFTIYSQNVFLDNSFVNKFNGEFDIEKKHNQGELYKAATKITTKNLIFEKHNGKPRILETKNPELCHEDTSAVYNEKYGFEHGRKI